MSLGILVVSNFAIFSETDKKGTGFIVFLGMESRIQFMRLNFSLNGGPRHANYLGMGYNKEASRNFKIS